jgi:hypothetical protein
MNNNNYNYNQSAFRDFGIIGDSNPQMQQQYNYQNNPLVPQQQQMQNQNQSQFSTRTNPNIVNPYNVGVGNGMNVLGTNNQQMYKFPDFDPNDAVTHPTDKIITTEHTFVIDSRQRDFKRYPSPSYYKVDLGKIYKNITSIELKGSAIPRSSYNVHSTNREIDFSIGSTITQIIVKKGGSGYVSPTVTISSPVVAGTQATATAFVDATGAITSIVVNIAGTGYRQGIAPEIIIRGQNNSGSGAEAYAIVGTHYTASIRPGQYTIGGNPTPPSTKPSGLILEIQNAMNYAVNGGNYDPASTGPFEVRLVSQYPVLGATLGDPDYYDTNAAQFNRIQITNVNSADWELLWFSGDNRRTNASNLLGFNNIDYSTTTITFTVANGSGNIMQGGTSIRADNDYNLMDDPKYILLSFWANSDSFERIESADGSINRKFGTMVFDANYANVLTDTTGVNYLSSGTNYLVGPVTKGTFYVPPGVLKPIRGFDFDQKKLEFAPAISKLSSLEIKFTQFSSENSAEEELYDFANQNHLLIFSVRSGDPRSGQKGS